MATNPEITNKAIRNLAAEELYQLHRTLLDSIRRGHPIDKGRYWARRYAIVRFAANICKAGILGGNA